MKKNYILKPFDIEKAKAGEPVCTRDGRDVRIICYDRVANYPIVALIDEEYESLEEYYPNGAFCRDELGSSYDLMMKVEEPTIFAVVGGEVISFEDAKRELGENITTLDFLIIKTYYGTELKIWKKNFGYCDWEQAQETASEIGDGWRCPTRRECLDIFDARYNGLDDAIKQIEGATLKDDIYWTCEKFQPNPNYAVAFSGFSGSLNVVSHFQERWVRPVKLIEFKEE